MACTINASSTNGIVQTADGSGLLKVQSGGVTTNALAWVNFNGTGTVAIRSSYNVSSITDGGTGVYTVNFTTAMSDANYAIIGSARNTSTGNTLLQPFPDSVSTVSSFAVVITASTTGTAQDPQYVNIAVFGN